jgi:hypothetical protein
MDSQTELMARAEALLSRAIADQDRAEHRRDLALYHHTERWDFVRGARELLKLANETEPAAKSLADVLA